MLLRLSRLQGQPPANILIRDVTAVLHSAIGLNFEHYTTIVLDGHGQAEAVSLAEAGDFA